MRAHGISTALILALLLTLFSPTYAQGDEDGSVGSECGSSPNDRELVKSAFPACGIDKLSWVAIGFWNEKTKEAVESSKSDLETLLRATSRRLLPDLEHEVLDPAENRFMLYKKQGEDETFLTRRAHLYCSIGALAQTGSYAVVTQCDLKTYLDLINSKVPLFSTGEMAMGPRRNLDETVKEIMRRAVQTLSDKFYTQISNAEQFEAPSQ